MNTVSSLLTTPFNLRSAEEKLLIKNLGRPTPTLNIEQVTRSRNRDYKRKFNPSIYVNHDWICGCEKTNSLYCFPCLLFGGGDLWSKTGMKDITHLAHRIRKHSHTRTHLTNAFSLSLFGKLDIASQLNSEYKKSVLVHNEKVRNNRYILNIVINCIRFCGAFELALRGCDESESSTPGVLRELVNFTAELDRTLQVHLDKATVLKGMPVTIQNEILQNMITVCKEEIIREICEADFVSVIVDETSDVANIFQMIVIFRYIVNGKPTERFWNLITPQKRSIDSLAASLLKELESVGINEQRDKLISQTYDGANVIAGSSGGVQAIVKQMYPHAEYIHCHAHQLNMVLLNAASMNRNVRIFSANLQGLCAFFSTSPQRMAVLDAVINKHLPQSVCASWSFHSCPVNTVFKNKEAIKECLRIIVNGDEFANMNTISLASGHLKILESEDFLFWLSLFHKVMPQVDSLFGELQKLQKSYRRDFDRNHVKKCIDAFKKNVIEIMKNIKDQESSNDDSKKRKLNNSELRREAIKVCDIIISQVKERFKFTGHLIGATVFLPEMFYRYDNYFPRVILNEICKVFPFIVSSRLETELSIIYSTKEFRSVSGAVGLFEFICENNLEDTFSEAVKLLKVLITIPMTTSEAESCFSTLKRIKTFLRNTMGQERLSELAMLSVEKDFIKNIVNFNQKIIDKFSHSEHHRMDFLLK